MFTANYFYWHLKCSHVILVLCRLAFCIFFRLVNNAVWSWKALRLLARKSPHFFTSQATNKPLKEYLQAMIEKTTKDMAATINTDAAVSYTYKNNLLVANSEGIGKQVGELGKL